MHVDPHPLETEFPEFAALIPRLRASNPEFAALVGRYDQVDREIVDLEEHDLPVSDEEIETMKKTRLHLKDDIYTMLKANS